MERMIKMDEQVFMDGIKMYDVQGNLRVHIGRLEPDNFGFLACNGKITLVGEESKEEGVEVKINPETITITKANIDCPIARLDLLHE